MSPTSLLVERFVIPVREENNRPGVSVAVKRYTPRLHPPGLRASHGVSLVLTHGVTFRIEFPFIHLLFHPP